MKLSRQDVFNKVWQHFVLEKNPRAITASLCMYRGPNGSKCAFGIFIPDDVYETDMEENGVDFIFKHYPEVFAQFDFHYDPCFWRDLQSCHDDAEDGTEWEVNIEGMLTRFAERHNLKLP